MKSFILLFTCITLGLPVIAQEDYKLLQSNVQIKGTSTLHDWMADVTKSDGTAELVFTNGNLTAIKNLTIHMDARTIKGQKGSTMDKNMYKALKTDRYTTISFI